MMLLLLTVIILAVLLIVPVWQRVAGIAKAWQGQLTQVALWSLVPISVLWALEMLEAGSGLLLGLPLAAGSGMLLLGLSGGWSALLSGRIAQGSLLLSALLSFQIFSGMEAFLAAAFLLTMAVIADALLDLIGSAPYKPISSSQGSVPLSSPELNGSVMGGKRSSSASTVGRIIEQAEQAANQADPGWIRARKLEDQSGLNRTSYRS